MDKFTTLTAVAAPMPMQNIDTDKVIPARFLKTIKRSGLGVHLFDPLRFDSTGNERPEFILNQDGYRNSQVIIAHENFGCGSSREHAPWALQDFGIRCIIAPSFADIFYNNIFKNGMLACKLPVDRVNELLRFLLELPGAKITVDLETQTIVGPDGKSDHFDIGASTKYNLLNGLDDIGLTLKKMPNIVEYERKTAANRAWLA